MENENSKIETLSGVGPKKAELLRSVGIDTLGELLRYFPSRYDYYKFASDVRSIDDGTKCLFYITYDGGAKRGYTQKTGYFVHWTAKLNGMTLSFVWFNQQYIIKMLQKGKRYLVKCTAERKGNLINSVNPHFILKDGINKSLLEPVYRSLSGISSKQIQGFAVKALELIGGELKDDVPGEIREKYSVSGLAEAYKSIHAPYNEEDCLKGMKRFIFEEFFTFRMRQILEKDKRSQKGAELLFEDEAIDEFKKRLPFRLTGAQEKAVADVSKDMKSPIPMNRIIQGDVGSGKTVVAFASCLMAMLAGKQSIIMVPTEVLARQHKDSFDSIFKGYGIKAELLVGSLKAKEKDKIKSDFTEGNIDVLIGTHAVIEDDVVSDNVGLVVTDEQHRFGVRQRFKLKSKGKPVNMLVMTATPIPRTLSMTVFGDLDVSIIDELPPDRKEIKTYSVNGSMRQRIHSFIAKEVASGRQAYIICPKVEESENATASVKEYIDTMAENGLKSVKSDILYGSMKPEDKEKVMDSFAEGNTDVLVSTTVIEVGINVPNATVIVIENAERFGLAQLHQLRGRVGRGKEQSYCILISDTADETAIARLKTLVSTTDGFEIAKEDMRLRGAGEYFGQKQSGAKQFSFGELPRDIDIFESAADAVSLVQTNKEKYKDFFELMKQKAEDLDKKIVFN